MHLALLRVFLSVVAALVALLPLAAQEQPAAGLKKNGNSYEHEASKTTFTLPASWQELKFETLATNSLLTVRQSEPGIEVTASWSPLGGVPWDDVVSLEPKTIPIAGSEKTRMSHGLEHDLLQMAYGVEAVGKPEKTNAGGREGVRILVKDGPTQNGKEAGAVYLVELGAGDSRWKLKLRATFPKTAQEASLKKVEELVGQQKW